MALGKRKTKQQELFIASNQIPKTPAHPDRRLKNWPKESEKFWKNKTTHYEAKET